MCATGMRLPRWPGESSYSYLINEHLKCYCTNFSYFCTILKPNEIKLYVRQKKNYSCLWGWNRS